MMIDKNINPLSTQDIRKEIKTRSILKKSQLELGETD